MSQTMALLNAIHSSATDDIFDPSTTAGIYHMGGKTKTKLAVWERPKRVCCPPKNNRPKCSKCRSRKTEQVNHGQSLEFKCLSCGLAIITIGGN